MEQVQDQLRADVKKKAKKLTRHSARHGDASHGDASTAADEANQGPSPVDLRSTAPPGAVFVKREHLVSPNGSVSQGTVAHVKRHSPYGWTPQDAAACDQVLLRLS